MGISVDHIVIAVPDLSVAKDHIRHLTGLVPADGGDHTGAGTRNLILPLASGYLELVTVRDRAEAERDSFGRLVVEALRTGRTLAAWMCEVSEFPENGAIHRLRRASRTFEIMGLEDSLAEPSRPSLIRRTAAPAAVPVDTGTEPVWRLEELRLSGPTTSHSEFDLWMSIGSTRVICAGESSESRIVSLTLNDGAGHRIVLDEQSWPIDERMCA